MYADKVKLDLQSLVFSFDGEKIGPAATPEALGMEDNDIIEVRATSNKKGNEWGLFGNQLNTSLPSLNSGF